MNAGVRADALVLIAAAIWGVAFYFQKTAMSHVGPLLFLGLRAALACAALLPFAMRELRVPGYSAIDVLPVASLGALTFFTAGAIQQHGIVTTTVINTGLLTALYLIVTPFAFWAIERVRPSAVIWLAALIAFGGVWALAGGGFGALSRGDVFVALSTLGWGVHIVIIGRAARYQRPITFTCIQFACVALAGLAAAVMTEHVSLDAVIGALDAILYVGLLSTALTFGLMAVALQHTKAPRAAILLSTEVLFSTAAGYVLLGERLDLIGWLGASLILVAVILVRLRTD